jgi:hypothetical protein
LTDSTTEKTIFKHSENDQRLLLFTTAEKASRYRASLADPALVVKLKEPSELRSLLASQGDESAFSIEIDAER